MSSSNIKWDQTQQPPQPQIVLHSPRDWTTYETRLNRALDELQLVFDKMPKPTKTEYSFLLYPSNGQRHPGSGTGLDLFSRMHAMKVCNVLLARLWRRRCSEVSDLHELIRKYQLKANSMRDDLFMRNNIIYREQQRSNRLEMELHRSKQGSTKIHNCETIENALNEAHLREQQLRAQLHAKSQECNNFSELLLASKTDGFRELRKYRECAQELAKQQVQNRVLEMRNTELEDKLLTLKDQFQLQNDETAFTVFESQERIDNANKTLKELEEELYTLEIKHNEMIRETQTIDILQAIEQVQQKIGLIRYSIYCYWTNYNTAPYVIVAKLLGFFLQIPMSRQGMAVTSLGLCMAIVILIGALC